MTPTEIPAPSAADAEERAWFSAIVESSFDAVIGKRLDGMVTSWNRAAEEIYGYSASEAIGRHISLIVPPDRRAELAEIMAGLARGEGVRGLETERIRKDGRRIEVSLTISPVFGAAGRVIGGSTIARDIGERKRTAAALQQSQERLSVALHAADIGLFRWEIEADRLEWDDTLKRIFGVPAGRTVASVKDFLEFVHPADREAVAAEVQRCIREHRGFEREFRILRPDGAVRWIADKARAVYAPDGRPLYLTGACRDVTVRRETQEALEAALREKELLLQEIDHRVKNSLQLVSGMLRLQAQDAGTPEVRQAFLEACNRVMMVARVHERLYKGETVRSVDLGAYLRDLCGDIGLAALADRHRIIVEAEPVTLSPQQAVPLGLIANELVTNALKYAYPQGAGGEVRVACRRLADRRLGLTVADSGAGLPEGFDPQTARSLGMRLICAFVQQLEGELRVETGPAGTRFEVAFLPG